MCVGFFKNSLNALLIGFVSDLKVARENMIVKSNCLFENDEQF